MVITREALYATLSPTFEDDADATNTMVMNSYDLSMK